MPKIETMTVNEAAARLRAAGLSIQSGTLADGIEAGVYPWALCIRTERSRVFQIFTRLLEQWIAERVVDDGEAASG